MQYTFAPCAGCQKPRRLINQKYKLCQECNYKRLHPGGKHRGGMNRKSDKQQEIDAALHRVYAEIAQERRHVCTGCGTTKYLSHSHLIRRSYRSDLVTVKENITYHCMSFGEHKGCHDKHERNIPGATGMLDFAHNMAYIKATDYTYYQQLLEMDRKFAESTGKPKSMFTILTKEEVEQAKPKCYNYVV